MTKHLASLTAVLERDRTPSKNTNHYGYDKIVLREYSGNVQEYTKWRSQVEDYLEQTAKQSTQRQAVNILDRLTLSEIDVMICEDLKAAWIKLTDKYGSPVYIACLLINDFLAFKLTKANDETNMLRLNNAMDKLESNLSIN